MKALLYSLTHEISMAVAYVAYNNNVVSTLLTCCSNVTSSLGPCHTVRHCRPTVSVVVLSLFCRPTLTGRVEWVPTRDRLCRPTPAKSMSRLVGRQVMSAVGAPCRPTLSVEVVLR